MNKLSCIVAFGAVFICAPSCFAAPSTAQLINRAQHCVDANNKLKHAKNCQAKGYLDFSTTGNGGGAIGPTGPTGTAGGSPTWNSFGGYFKQNLLNANVPPGGPVQLAVPGNCNAATEVAVGPSAYHNAPPGILVVDRVLPNIVVDSNTSKAYANGYTAVYAANGGGAIPAGNYNFNMDFHCVPF